MNPNASLRDFDGVSLCHCCPQLSLRIYIGLEVKMNGVRQLKIARTKRSARCRRSAQELVEKAHVVLTERV